MTITTALAFMLGARPTSVLQPWNLVESFTSQSVFDEHHVPWKRHRESRAVEITPHAQIAGSTARRPRSELISTVSVCTDNDCLQQGAARTLETLKEAVEKNEGVKVNTCPCVGMCGLGPCVNIDWDGSGLESRGGIYPDDDEKLLQVVEDAVNPPRLSKARRQRKSSYDDDPYAEQ